MRARAAGFTLLEVLIALGIFALIGVASWRVLDVLVSSEAASARHAEAMRERLRALDWVRRDLLQAVARPVRDEQGRELEAMRFLEVDRGLELTRGGWMNPRGIERSDLQRVAYRLGPHPEAGQEDSPHYGDDKQYLLRDVWLALDRTAETPRLTQALLPDVRLLEWRFLGNGWQTRWPPASEGGRRDLTVLPTLVELSIELEDGSTLSRQFLSPGTPWKPRQ